jgi:tRNA A-37 threonylcarbamoyl transferase component Bud32
VPSITTIHFKSKAQTDPLWRCLLSAIPLILAISLVTTQLHNMGWLQTPENLLLDALVSSNPLDPAHVFVVGIDNADYDKMFKGQSPLDPKQLSSLISMIAEGQPKLILVDINTADARFKNMPLPRTGSTKVYWSRGGTAVDKNDDVLMPDGLLGGKQDSGKELSGIAILPQDANDGKIRYYCRYLKIKNEQGKVVTKPTLYWAVTQAFREKPDKGEAISGEPMILLSLGPHERFNKKYSAGILPVAHNTSGWKDLVKGKIVLLGGFYDAARDNYPSASGNVPGVELQAAAIESELIRGGIPTINSWVLLALQILIGTTSVIINWRFGRRWKGLPPVASLLASAALLAAFSAWWLYLVVDFVPVITVVQLQHLLASRARNKAIAKAEADARARQVAIDAKDMTVQQSSPASQRTNGSSERAAVKMRHVCLTCGHEFPDGTIEYCPYDGAAVSQIIDEDLVGTTFAQRYAITDFLGQGGVSTVYKARHQLMGKLVAVKVLRSHLQADKDSLMRFQQEAKATSMITRHQNVMSVSDFGITGEGKAFMVMDYIEGMSLKESLLEDGPLTPEAAVELFVQICDGLACAHASGVIHRDLKPSNIMMVHENGQQIPKIVDFGLAKIASSDLSLTSTGQVLGSPLYMSPEQCMGDKLDHRSDIYSLGCIMYECLAGRPPFIGESILDVFRLHAEGLPAPFVQNVPSWLIQIICVALAKRPEDRFESASELRDSLLAKNTSRTAAQSVIMTMEHDAFK